MAKTYRPYCPDQMFLLPPSLKDGLPENHLVYFISDVVDQLDLSKIEPGPLPKEWYTDEAVRGGRHRNHITLVVGSETESMITFPSVAGSKTR